MDNSRAPDPAPKPDEILAPTRDTALRELSAALTVLGDDASRATRGSRDVRLHVVACQAQHLAGEVDALAAPDTHLPVWPAPAGFATSTVTARTALDDPAIQPLPAQLAASLHWLLLLAEAAQT